MYFYICMLFITMIIVFIYFFPRLSKYVRHHWIICIFCALILSVKNVIFQIFFYYITSFNRINKKSIFHSKYQNLVFFFFHYIFDSLSYIWKKTTSHKCDKTERNLVRTAIIEKILFLKPQLKRRNFHIKTSLNNLKSRNTWYQLFVFCILNSMLIKNIKYATGIRHQYLQWEW